jgi:hypothetical protein
MVSQYGESENIVFTNDTGFYKINFKKSNGIIFSNLVFKKEGFDSIIVELKSGTSGKIYLKPSIEYLLDTITEDGFYLPKNIYECIIEIDNSLTDKSKHLIKDLGENELYKLEDIYIIDEWKIYDNSRTTRLFHILDLYAEDAMKEIILLCYKRHLNGEELSFENEVHRNKLIQDSIAFARRKEYEFRTKLDTIEGVYIPKNFKECCILLDAMLEASTKDKIKSITKRELIEFHMSLGRFLRNSWGLWGGSRLQLYLIS